jgi:allantoinase
MIDFAITSNRVVLPAGIKKAAVLIRDGTIIDVVDSLTGEQPVVDMGDLVLMPGIVDPHVHINEPGRTEWEGFDTATRAAIAGGITTLIEMPLNASPVTTSVAAFQKKIGATQSKLHCDCGFWGGVVPGNEKEILPLISAGVFGFKAFLVHSGIDEFPPVDETQLRKSMPLIAKQGLPLLVHCELRTSEIQLTDKRSYADYLASRPKKWENDAIALMIRLCREFNCRTHIVHLSSAESIPQIRAAREEGLPLTVETTQHYLYFNAEDIPDGATVFKCAPPIREKTNNELLWQALKEGVIDFVATDHSPAPPEMKEIASGDFEKAWGGIASLQFALPVLWTAAKKHGCSISDLAAWLTMNPSLLPQLQTRGKIQKGCRADLVAWDPDATFTVSEDMIRHKHKLTPYLNEKLSGVVHYTWLNGKQVFDSGKFLHLNKGHVIYHE